MFDAEPFFLETAEWRIEGLVSERRTGNIKGTACDRRRGAYASQAETLLLEKGENVLMEGRKKRRACSICRAVSVIFWW